MKSRMSKGTGSAANDHGLTPREMEIIGLARGGLSRKEIVGCLKVSINTVSAHLKNIYRKLGVSSLVCAINKLEKHYDALRITNAFC